ncbi:MAG: hypothetical protein E7254_09305 [Lachnospiraceae bacterium]|nr:hypothetical protein [Lachnospiraceae bacterium]
MKKLFKNFIVMLVVVALATTGVNKVALADSVTVANPTFDKNVMAGGAPLETVSIFCETEGAEIYYTIDGSDPRISESRTLYDLVIMLDHDAVIKACAKLGDTYSEVVQINYDYPEPQNYTIEIEVEGKGTATSSTDLYNGYNTVFVQLNATPAKGYKFQEWKVRSKDGKPGPAAVFVEGNKFANTRINPFCSIILTAVFVKDEVGTEAETQTQVQAEKLKKPVISTVQKKHRKIIVKWNKNKNKTFEVNYSTSKKFKKFKSVTVNNKFKFTLKSVKKGKRYYFRVRSLSVDGKNHSKWSKVKSIKIKKD